MAKTISTVDFTRIHNALVISEATGIDIIADESSLGDSELFQLFVNSEKWPLKGDTIIKEGSFNSIYDFINGAGWVIAALQEMNVALPEDMEKVIRDVNLMEKLRQSEDLIDNRSSYDDDIPF